LNTPSQQTISLGGDDMMNSEHPPTSVELIVYARPQGLLADQLQRYFSQAKRTFSWNPAHDYMPHCSVTGFFHDFPNAIPKYVKSIDEAVEQIPPGDFKPVIGIQRMMLNHDFHGLILESDWLPQFAEAFVARAPNGSRLDTLRIKHWLHLSFAYQFPIDENQALSDLARQTVTLTAPVQWELCFYQRHPDKSWSLHGQWTLDTCKEPAYD
jgi:ubiquitin-associated SH3 domain-containing protein